MKQQQQLRGEMLHKDERHGKSAQTLHREKSGVASAEFESLKKPSGEKGRNARSTFILRAASVNRNLHVLATRAVSRRSEPLGHGSGQPPPEMVSPFKHR